MSTNYPTFQSDPILNTITASNGISGTIGQFSALTGAAIKSNFIGIATNIQAANLNINHATDANTTNPSQKWSWSDSYDYGLRLDQIHPGDRIDYGFRIRNGSQSDIETIYFRSNGNVGIGTNLPTNKLDVNGAANFTSNIIVSGGVRFPASMVLSSDPNTLDDYEEGTWTPSLFCSNNTSFTYDFQEGRYTKIGNKVFLEGTITISDTGSSSGNVLIADFPFTSISSSPYGFGIINSDTLNTSTVTGSLVGQFQVNSTLMALCKNASGGTEILQASDLTYYSSFYFTVIYTTT